MSGEIPAAPLGGSFELLVGSVRDYAILLLDTEGCVRSWNPGAELIKGWTAQEIVGRHFSAFYPQEAVASGHLDHELEVAARTGRYEEEGWRVRKDGSQFWANVVITALRDDAGALVGYGKVTRDLTERKRAEDKLREAEEKMRLLVSGTRDYAILMLDPEGKVATWNSGAQHIKGYAEAEVLGRHFSMFYPDGDIQTGKPARALQQAREQGRWEEEGWRVRKDGSRFWASVVITSIWDEQGELRGYGKVTRDLTERKRAADRLREAEDRLRRAFDAAPTGAALLSRAGHIMTVNTALTATLRRSADELEGQLFDLVIPPGTDERGGLAALMSGDTEQLAVTRRLTVQGKPAWLDLRVVPLLEGGVIGGFIAHVQDVTQQRDYEEQLASLADTDPVTGLLNRRRFSLELENHLQRAVRYGVKGALLMLDLDNFKRVNDSLGHNAGDEIIIGTAQLLKQRLRASDVVCRLGGDEFAILLPHADRDEAETVATMIVERIRDSVSVFSGGRERPVTASVGVALIEDAKITVGELMALADAAMYDSKDAGRNCYSFAKTDLYAKPRSQARHTWAERIERALDEDHFVLHAQPIQDLVTGRNDSYELLLRMTEPEGLIGPQTFLYIAERLGLMADIDRWVVRRSVQILEVLQKVRPHIRLEVNLSGHSIGDPQFREDITDIVSGADINTRGLVFEITETAAVTQIAKARDFADHLREMGCRFALDDFGAGFGSFYYLKHLPFDFVKIDGEFVSACTTNRMDQMVIRSLVTIARGLGKQTIAEFVGDQDTQDFLATCGVDLGQGFHLGKPAPLESFFPGIVVPEPVPPPQTAALPWPREADSAEIPAWPGQHQAAMVEVDPGLRRWV